MKKDNNKVVDTILVTLATLIIILFPFVLIYCTDSNTSSKYLPKVILIYLITGYFAIKNAIKSKKK